MQRGHRGQGVASQDTVEPQPVVFPEVFPVLDHEPSGRRVAAQPPLRAHGLAGERLAQLRRLDRAAGEATSVERRVPGRSGRDDPVEDRPEVEDRVGHRGSPRKALAVTPEDVGECGVRHGKPRPVGPHEHVVEGSPRAALLPGPLQADRWQLSEPEDPVDRDRVVDPQPSFLRAGVVVGELVRRQVSPHLQTADGHVPLPRPAHGHRESDGGTQCDCLRDDRPGREAPADERCQHPRSHQRPRGCS